MRLCNHLVRNIWTWQLFCILVHICHSKLSIHTLNAFFRALSTLAVLCHLPGEYF